MNREAFRQELTTFLQAEQERIYRLAYTYTRDEQEALDVVQTAMTRALAAKPMREPRYLKTWVYRIVVNTAIDGLRARQRVFASDDPRDVAPYAEHDAAGLDLRQALAHLPADLRTIIVLRYFEDLPLREIAAILRLNLNTLKTRLYRALALLRVEMEDGNE